MSIRYVSLKWRSRNLILIYYVAEHRIFAIVYTDERIELNDVTILFSRSVVHS